MPFGNVYLSNPFNWRQHFFKGDKIKKRVKNYYVWGASSRNYNKIVALFLLILMQPQEKRLKLVCLVKRDLLAVMLTQILLES